MKHLKKYIFLLLCASTAMHAVQGPIITDISDYTPMFKRASHLNVHELEELISTYKHKISDSAHSVHAVVNAITNAYNFIVDNRNTIGLMLASTIAGGLVVIMHRRYQKYCKQQRQEEVEKIVRSMPEIQQSSEEKVTARKIPGLALDAATEAERLQKT